MTVAGDISVSWRPIRKERERRAHALEFAEGGAYLVDHVRRVGAKPAATLGGVAPPRRDLGGGVRERGHLKEEGGEARLADLAVVHRTGGEGLPRGPAELGAEQVDDTGLFGGVAHAPRLGGILREGLLANDVFSGCDGGQHDLGMGIRRGRDGDGVDPRQRQCLAEGGEPVVDPEQGGPCGGLVGVAAHQGAHVEAGAPQGPQVGQDTESSANHHRTELFVGLPDLQDLREADASAPGLRMRGIQLNHVEQTVKIVLRQRLAERMSLANLTN